MKKIKLMLVIMMLILTPSCAIFKREGEFQIKEEVVKVVKTEHELMTEAVCRVLDKELEARIEAYDKKKREEFREKLSWVLGTTLTIVTLIATTGGLILLQRKLKVKNGNV